eukprot:5812146-Pleurochrysis_carterae.AAC.2
MESLDQKADVERVAKATVAMAQQTELMRRVEGWKATTMLAQLGVSRAEPKAVETVRKLATGRERARAKARARARH